MLTTMHLRYKSPGKLCGSGYLWRRTETLEEEEGETNQYFRECSKTSEQDAEPKASKTFSE